MNQLTTIAALPGSGAGCASALKREVAEQPRKYATGGLVVNVVNDIKALNPEVQKMITASVAESMRRTLLKIAGATA